MNLSPTKPEIPGYVRTVLERLVQSGFEAYAVGGCVRDTLLGLTPDDWDVTTSALPQETAGVFAGFHVIETGLKHGTLTVRSEHKSVEVTTFRTDGEYSDHRHPESVTFSRSLADDLSRRDFTVNAMCLSPDGEITDVFGGRDDLKNRIIRCVGDPDRRFDEDALRILRALRFAATLSFSVETNTTKAIKRNKALLHAVSSERIFAELKKTLLRLKKSSVLLDFSDVIYEVIPELQSVPKDKFAFSLDKIPGCGDLTVCLALFLSDLNENAANSILRRLRSDNRTRETVCFLIKNKNTALTDVGALLRLIGENGTEAAEKLRNFRKRLCTNEDETAGLTKALSLARGGAAVKIADLALDGKEISALGFKGREIGNISKRLLFAVTDGDAVNTKEGLISYIRDNLY